MEGNEKIYNFDIPSFDLKELITLKKVYCEFDDNSDLVSKAEILVNYIDKLEKVKKLQQAYQSAINAILGDIPVKTKIYTQNGKCYNIVKKICDKEYVECYNITESETLSCSEEEKC